MLAFFLRFVPKKGPFRALAFKMPSQHAEDMYLKSVNETVERYRKVLQEAGHPSDCQSDRGDGIPKVEGEIR